jgi:SAM-dependent methyltransferase
MSPEPTHSTVKCVVCDSAAGYVQLATLQQGAVLCCKSCGTHSISPQPAIEELVAAYQDFDAGEIARQEFDAYVAQAKIILQSDLRMAGIRTATGLKFLDYGCGGGHFVKAAADLGAEARGIDLDEEDAKFGRLHEVPIDIGDYRDLDEKLGPRTFSAILINHVLEHIPRPADALTALLRKLDLGGVLIIRVPDQDSLPSHIKRVVRKLGVKISEWGFVQPPIHLHGYSTKTFQTLADIHNLEIVRLSKVSPLDQNEFPTTDRYWKNLAVHRFVYRLARIFGSGGHLVAILRRPTQTRAS